MNVVDQGKSWSSCILVANNPRTTRDDSKTQPPVGKRFCSVLVALFVLNNDSHPVPDKTVNQQLGFEVASRALVLKTFVGSLPILIAIPVLFQHLHILL